MDIFFLYSVRETTMQKQRSESFCKKMKELKGCTIHCYFRRRIALWDIYNTSMLAT